MEVCFHVVKQDTERSTNLTALDQDLAGTEFPRGGDYYQLLGRNLKQIQCLNLNVLLSLPSQSITFLKKFFLKGSKAQPLPLLASSCLLTHMEREIWKDLVLDPISMCSSTFSHLEKKLCECPYPKLDLNGLFLYFLISIQKLIKFDHNFFFATLSLCSRQLNNAR